MIEESFEKLDLNEIDNKNKDFDLSTKTKNILNKIYSKKESTITNDMPKNTNKVELIKNNLIDNKEILISNLKDNKTCFKPENKGYNYEIKK